MPAPRSLDIYAKLDKASPRTLQKRKAELESELARLKADELSGKDPVGRHAFGLANELGYIKRLLKRNVFERVFDANDRVVQNTAGRIPDIAMGDGVLKTDTVGPVINSVASVAAAFGLAVASVPSTILRRAAKIGGALTGRPVRDPQSR